MKTLTFMRHGHTEISKDANMLADGAHLSALGIEESNKLAKELESKKFDIIITANSLRTKETAEIISQTLKLPIMVDNNFNPWKAAKNKNFLSYWDYFREYIDFAKHNGIKENSSWEDFYELQARTKRGIENALKFEAPLIITHSIIISLYTGISREGIPYCKPIPIVGKDLQCKNFNFYKK